MIKTVIFDIGRVLVGYDWDAHLMRLFDNDRALVDRLKDALFEHKVWTELDRGVWSEEEILEGFYRYAPDLKSEILYFYNNAGGALWQYDFTKELITNLKERGYQVLFLSNWSEHMKELCPQQLDFLPLVDGGIFSCDVKMVKPNHDIYEAIIEKYNLIPEECVFLDDMEKNVVAARECGLNAIQVVDNDEAHEELERMLSQK